MQHATLPTSGSVASVAPPGGTPAEADGAAGGRTAGGRSDGHGSGVALFRRYAVAWVPAAFALLVIELLALPTATPSELVTGITLVALTAGCAAALLFAGYALTRERPGAWPLAATAVVDVAALVVAAVSATGNDTAIVLPFLGGLLLVSLYDGRALKLGLGVQWLVGVAGAALAYLGPMSRVPLADPPPVSIAVSAVMTFVGYCLLWWVRHRLAAAISVAEAAEAQAEQQAAALEALLAGSPVATMALDLRGHVVRWNPAAEAVFGWPAADLAGATADVLAEPASEAAPSTIVARVLGGEPVGGLRATWRRRDGAALAVDLHAALVQGPDGRPSGVVLQAVDETEREGLRARVAEGQRLEAVGRLAGGVAHDFNNLLTAVTGYAQLLRVALPEDDPRAEDAHQIELAAGRGADLVRQLLTFGRRQVTRPIVVDPNALVEGLRPMLGRLIGTSVRIRVELDPDVPRVCADPGQLEQVLVNLAVNARDAMPDGGDLVIRTSATVDAAGSSVVRLSVIDTGAGMDGATQARVFEPFFTTKAQGRGTGLGLATVYGIVTGHGGNVSLVSAPGRGTTFHVDLPPVTDAADDEPAVAPASLQPRRGTGTVLVVDDEESIRGLATRALSAAGYRVLEAGDLWGALRAASTEPGPIDLVLADLIMPDCRGPEVARRVALLHPEARILYMSGYQPDARSPEAELDAPMLAKPFTVAELARAASDRIEERQPQPVG